MDNLKPCPFCGGEAIIRVVTNQTFIECSKCYAQSANVLGMNYTLEQSVKAWNQRKEMEEIESQNDALATTVNQYVSSYYDLRNELKQVKKERDANPRPPNIEGEIGMYVYIRSEPQLWTVGFYDPEGNWHPESDHGSAESAAERVHYLNGGKP